MTDRIQTRLLVSGSRDWTDREAVRDALALQVSLGGNRAVLRITAL